MLLANVRSVINKRDALNSIIDNCGAGIIALTETWLHPQVYDCEILDISRFHIFRCDRMAGHGGGVLLAISKSLPCHKVNFHSDLEIVCASVDIGHRKFIFAVCYRPPSYPSSFTAELHDALSTLFVLHPKAPVILMGDFNFPNIIWNADPPACHPYSSKCNDFLDLCSLFSLTQLVCEPTRISKETANILDLILCSHPDLITDVSCIPGVSDHLALSYNVTSPLLKPAVKNKLIYDYNKANVNNINLELSNFFDLFLSNFDDRTVDNNWIIFRNKVHELTDKFIPSRIIASNSKAPWFNSHLKRLCNRKKRLYRLAKKKSFGI